MSLRIRSLAEGLYESKYGKILKQGTQVRVTWNHPNVHGKTGQIVGLAGWNLMLGQCYIVKFSNEIENYGYTTCIIAEEQLEIVEEERINANTN